MRREKKGGVVLEGRREDNGGGKILEGEVKCTARSQEVLY